MPRVALPSPECPSAGSRGPGPHPVLRNPPPARRSGLYPSVELARERLRLRHRELADVVLADVGGGPTAHGGPLGQERQPPGGGVAPRRAPRYPVPLGAPRPLFRVGGHRPFRPPP